MFKINSYLLTAIATLTGILIVMVIHANITEPETTEEQLTEMLLLGKHCSYVIVGDKPIICNAGDLIFVDKKVARKYCFDRYIERFENNVYCVYNGVNSVSIDSSPDAAGTSAIMQSFRNRKTN